MRIEQRRPTQSLRELCSLLGYSRQAYYKHLRAEEKEALGHDLLLQQVDVLRKTQKRIGSRKLLGLLSGFVKQHQLSIGRDAFFDLLRENSLLVRKRKRSKPQTFTSLRQHFGVDLNVSNFV